ncbi:unnamed protein product [Prunus armeniaca]
MKKYGYHQSNSDHTLFIKRMDDTRDDVVEMGKLQKYLASKFKMKDLRALKYFLGIEVTRSATSICLSQRKYVLDMLIETSMLGCAPPKTLIVQNHHLAIYPDQVPPNKGIYQSLVGRLIYLWHTELNNIYAVSVVSQFMYSPTDDHLATDMRILSYLKKVPSQGLIFRKLGNLDVKGYTHES